MGKVRIRKVVVLIFSLLWMGFFYRVVFRDFSNGCFSFMGRRRGDVIGC